MKVHWRVKELGIDLVNVALPETVNRHSQTITETQKIAHGDYNGVHHFRYCDGFCIIKTDYAIDQPLTEFINVKKDYIQVSLQVSGKSDLQKSTGAIKTIPKGALQVAFRKEINAQVKSYPGHGNQNYLRIFISRDFYLNLVKHEMWADSDDFYQRVAKHEYVRFGNVLIPQDFKLTEILDEILLYRHEGAAAIYYLQAKLRELFLTVHILNGCNTSQISSSDELKKLEDARLFLENHYASPPTIKQLSRIIGLNEFKLKQGFKEIYKCTIKEFITNLRLHKARRMLSENQSVNDVAHAVGYKSVSHFIKTYRKLYGNTPKQNVG